MNENPLLNTSFLQEVIATARDAGRRILEVYHGDFAVEHKDDGSPLTMADLAAHRAIVAGLKQIDPAIPVLSEEAEYAPFRERSRWDLYWLVDPLDGTREFVKRNDEFTVNIALIERQVPVLGVILAPVTGACYYAARGLGARKWEAGEVYSIRVRPSIPERITVTTSRSRRNLETQQFIRHLGNTEVLYKGSSLKSCLIAEGIADIYPCFGPTSEWDTAAAQCLVEEAGGRLADTCLQPLRYNTRESLVNPPFLAFGDLAYDWRKLLSAIGK